MKAIMFGTEPEGHAHPAVAAIPMALQDLPDPVLIADDWVVLRTRLCGICGSDTKQARLDGDFDNAMTAVISFPQILGHEVVAEVAVSGSESGLEVGQRVVLNPWLSCAPRGLPLCPACASGRVSLCHNFTRGRLEPGIHTGNSATATGGFAELLPAHASMCIPIPDDVPDEVAVLADPFSVSLHAVLRNPPPPDGTALVYGVGALGTAALHILRALYPGVRVAAVTQHPHQVAMAEATGALAIDSDPATIVESVAAFADGEIQRPFDGLPWLHPGGVDVIYDTVASPQTLEVGVRVARARGTISISGVATPGRFEWTPWYFKELVLVGSNAFGIEEVDGVAKHAMEHYLDLVRSGLIALDGMLTHTFPLQRWGDAFATIIDQADTGAIKVAFDLR